MTDQIKDRVKESSTLTGTGLTIPLTGAETGYKSFSDSYSTSASARIPYLIESADLSQWEYGLAKYDDPGGGAVLTREVVIDSSTGSLIDFLAGPKTVTVPLLAAQSGILDSKTTVSSGSPSVGSDETLGYTAGSLWFSLDTFTWYVCDDPAEGAAVWRVSGYDSGFYGRRSPKQRRYSYGLELETTDATPTAMAPDHWLVAAFDPLALGVNESAEFSGKVMARSTTTTIDHKTWNLKGLVYRDGSGNITAEGSLTATADVETANATTWSLAVTVNTGTQKLVITATGQAARTLRWTADLQMNVLAGAP